MRVYGTVVCRFTYMYDISDVSESEENGGKVGYDIPTVAYYVKIFEPLAYIPPQTSVHDAGTAEPVAVNVFFDIGTVIYAEFMA